MSALSAYLAKNYLSASNPSDLSQSERPKKRRKREKASTSETTLLIADDEDLLLSSKSVVQDDDDTPMYTTNTRSAEFRKAKKNNWQSLGPASTDTPNDDADKILREAAAESARRRQDIDDEDAPAIVEDETSAAPRMSSGAKAGLQTAADTAVMESQTRAPERKKKPKAEVLEETIYRDATGRRIDVSMKRAEARAAELEKIKAERKEKENAMGDVQRAEKEARKEDLENAKFLNFARTADDEDLNEHQKEQVRWDDPMAQYIAKKRAEEAPVKSRSEGNEGRAKVQQAKVYPGAAPPNRYGIKPGWRWDGVDRGNGFEKDWFQARSRKDRNEKLSYQWQMDE